MLLPLHSGSSSCCFPELPKACLLGPVFLSPFIWYNVYLESLPHKSERQCIIGREEPKEERTWLRDDCSVVLKAEKGLALRIVSDTAQLKSGHPSPAAGFFPFLWRSPSRYISVRNHICTPPRPPCWSCRSQLKILTVMGSYSYGLLLSCF